MDLLVLPDGTIRAVYAEDIDFREFGKPLIARASHVELTARAAGSPISPPLPAPFSGHSTCEAKLCRPNRSGLQ